MRIKQYSEATTANDTDVMIIENATETQHITFLNLFNKIKEKLKLGTLANKSKVVKSDLDTDIQETLDKADTVKNHAFADPINNLVSTDSTKSLAAAQGKVLSDSISALNSDVTQQINELNENLKNNSRIIIHKGELAASGRGSFPAHSVAIIYNNNTLADIHISFIIGDYVVGSRDDYSIFSYDYLKAACGNKEVYWDPFSSFVQMFNDSVASYPENYIGRTGLLFYINSLKQVMFARAYDADMKVGGWGTSEEKLYKNIGTHVIVDIYRANLS